MHAGTVPVNKSLISRICLKATQRIAEWPVFLKIVATAYEMT